MCCGFARRAFGICLKGVGISGEWRCSNETMGQTGLHNSAFGDISLRVHLCRCPRFRGRYGGHNQLSACAMINDCVSAAAGARFVDVDVNLVDVT